MSVATQPHSPLYRTAVIDTRRFSVDEYHRMIQAGVLTEDDPVELLEGWIVFQMPRGPRHDSTLHKFGNALATHFGAAGEFEPAPPSRSTTASQNPIWPWLRGRRHVTTRHIPGRRRLS